MTTGTARENTPPAVVALKLDDAIPAASQSDREALFRKLLAEHSVRLYRFVLRRVGNPSDAEEIAQQAFVEAACAYDNYRGDSKLSTWLYGIALNLVRNHLNRCPQQRYAFETFDSEQDSPVCGTNLEHNFAARQQLQQILALLETLPADMREVLLLVGVREMSYEETSDALGIPIGTVRSRLSRARAALREKMDSFD